MHNVIILLNWVLNLCRFRCIQGSGGRIAPRAGVHPALQTGQGLGTDRGDL